MAFLGLPWLFLGPNESKMGAKMVSKRDPKCVQKMNRQSGPTNDEISDDDSKHWFHLKPKNRSDPK